MIQFKCSRCGALLAAGDEQAGVSAACPKCKGVTPIPASPAAGPGRGPEAAQRGPTRAPRPPTLGRRVPRQPPPPAHSVMMIVVGLAMLFTIVVPWASLPRVGATGETSVMSWQFLDAVFTSEGVPLAGLAVAVFMVGCWGLGLFTAVLGSGIAGRPGPRARLGLGMAGMASFALVVISAVAPMPQRPQDGSPGTKLLVNLLGALAIFAFVVATHVRLRIGNRRRARSAQCSFAGIAGLLMVVELVWSISDAWDLPRGAPGSLGAMLVLSSIARLVVLGACGVAVASVVTDPARVPAVSMIVLGITYGAFGLQCVFLLVLLADTPLAALVPLLRNVLLLLVLILLLLGSGIVGLWCEEPQRA